MIENPSSLTIPDFDTDDLAVADVFRWERFREPVDPEAPAVINVGLNSADLAYVYLAIDPGGEAVLAREDEEMRLTDAVWLDLRPAEALELASRLRICAEAAARFDAAFPEEIDEAVASDDRVDA